ncbi:MAG: AmmeMemoRadiSam system radical SAM enzyme [Promethearchaeia archaeon]
MEQFPDIPPRFLKKGKYQSQLKENLVRCGNCEHKCKIKPGKIGVCGTRLNNKNTIYSIVYGCIPALSINPIEKKPLFHFYPGTKAITAGTYGCNFNCFWCQNHHLSHPKFVIRENLKDREDLYIPPQDLIKKAIENNCQGTSISFNEPTLLFEYALEVFSLAKEQGLYNTYVSNGYMTEQVLRDLAKHGLDAINIDIKGDKEMVEKYCNADVEKGWRNAKLAIELGIHTEITILIIEGFNSEEKTVKKMTKRILNELGEDIAVHLNRFYPHYKSSDYGLESPTDRELMRKVYNVAKDQGLKYVYLGNLPTTEYQHTRCPNCSKIVIKRGLRGIEITRLNEKGECINCGENLFDKTELWRKS